MDALGGDGQHQATWLRGLYPQDESHARLITRNRVRYTWRMPWVLYYLLQDVGDIFMMRKCMRGIKQRAERVSVARPPTHRSSRTTAALNGQPVIRGSKARVSP